MVEREEVRRFAIRVAQLQRLPDPLPADVGADVGELFPTIAREDVRGLVPRELVDVVAVGRSEVLGRVIGLLRSTERSVAVMSDSSAAALVTAPAPCVPSARGRARHLRPSGYCGGRPVTG